MMNTNQPPRLALGTLPTPVAELDRLGPFLGGPKLYIKRDDLTGLAMGGNKTRKLEFILADAVAKGCDTLITAGSAQSNHCRQTAAAAAAIGMECHLVLGGEAPERYNGNLLLDAIFGSHLHWCGRNRKGEDLPRIYKTLLDAGRKPYVIPYGGSNELGAYAYFDASRELVKQTSAVSFSHVVVASGSGGTQAGLILGQQLLGLPYEVIGIGVDKGDIMGTSLAESILALIQGTARSMGSGQEMDRTDVHLNMDYVGAGYGQVGAREKEAITLVARHEGILLDPVYTARAMAALIDLIRSKVLSRSDHVLFWHTGGHPGLFAYASALGPTAAT